MKSQLSQFARSYILLFVSVAGVLAPTLLRAEVTAFAKGANAYLTINLISFDASTGDLQGRLNLKIPASEATEETFSPKLSYTLVDELTISESVLQIKSNAPYSCFNNFLPTSYQVDDAGNQFNYPFDHHRTALKVFVKRQLPGDPATAKYESVPFTVDTSLACFEGYSIKLIPGKENSPTFLDLTIDLQRTWPIKFFTVFVSALMLLVALGFLKMVLKLAYSHSPPDINEMAFGGALLFAFPAIRNIEPFVPPMGVLSDFFGFFWAESIVAIALIIHLYCWLKRKQHE
jgi:hypothetical protein